MAKDKSKHVFKDDYFILLEDFFRKYPSWRAVVEQESQKSKKEDS